MKLSFFIRIFVRNKKDKKDMKAKKVISATIESLKLIKRFDIDTNDNGEFIEKDIRFEEDGEYIRAEDIKLLIQELECVKSILTKN